MNETISWPGFGHCTARWLLLLHVLEHDVPSKKFSLSLRLAATATGPLESRRELAHSTALVNR